MAKYAPIILTVFLLAGCQQATNSSMVQTLPAPNFSGPTFADRPAPPPAPVPTPPVAVAPRPQPGAPPKISNAGVPADWIPYAAPNQWTYIVIHHSATPFGGAARFDKEHREVRHFDELGYHFVIGNGTDTRDGQIEVGPRCRKQKWGAHAQTLDERFNQHGIGICLVGNFDITHPTDAQMHSLEKLVAYLMKTYHVSADHVLGHRDTKPTECPGRYLNVATVRRASVQLLADAGEKIPPDSDYAMRGSREMLTDIKR